MVKVAYPGTEALNQKTTVRFMFNALVLIIRPREPFPKVIVQLQNLQLVTYKFIVTRTKMYLQLYNMYNYKLQPTKPIKKLQQNIFKGIKSIFISNNALLLYFIVLFIV